MPAQTCRIGKVVLSGSMIEAFSDSGGSFETGRFADQYPVGQCTNSPVVRLQTRLARPAHDLGSSPQKGAHSIGQVGFTLRPCDTEVDQHCLIIGSDTDIRRLDVSVQHSGGGVRPTIGVQVVHGPGDLCDPAEPFLAIPVSESFGQRFAGDPLGDRIEDPEIILTGRKCGSDEGVQLPHDVWTVDVGQHRGPLGQTLVVVKRERRQHLEGDLLGVAVDRSDRPVDETFSTVPLTDRSLVSDIDPIPPWVFTGACPQ